MRLKKNRDIVIYPLPSNTMPDPENGYSSTATVINASSSEVASQKSELSIDSSASESQLSEVISVHSQNSVVEITTVNDQIVSLNTGEQDLFNYIFDTLSSKSQHHKKNVNCFARTGNIFWFFVNTGVIIIVCAHGPLFYIQQGYNYVQNVLPLQIMFATLGPIAISAPGIWTGLNITKAIRPMPSHKKKIVNYKVKPCFLILRVVRDVVFAIAALASVIPFARITIENNKDNIWLAVIATGDVTITRFLMHFFSIMNLLTYNPIACNLVFNEKNEKKMLLHMRKRLIDSLINARSYFIVHDMEIGKKTFSLRYKNYEDGILSAEKITAAKNMLQQLLGIGIQNQTILDKRQLCRSNSKKWIGIILGIIGGLVSVVGLAGFSVKTFGAVALLTDYIPNIVLAKILQYSVTIFSMLPFYYIVWYQGRKITTTLYDYTISFATFSCKKKFQNNLALKLYPILTLSLMTVSMCISSLSWASNVKVVNETFSGVAAIILGLFSILTWVTFTFTSMVTGVIFPVVFQLAKWSCKPNTKEKAELITGTLDVFIDTIKKMPLDGTLGILKNLSDKIVIGLLNGIMEKKAFDDLFAKIVVNNNEQASERPTESELVTTIGSEPPHAKKNLLQPLSSSNSVTLFQPVSEIEIEQQPDLTHQLLV